MKDAIIPYSIIDTFAALDNIYEARLLGWVLAKAQAVLKLRQRDLKELNLEHALDVVRVTIPARYILEKGATNYAMVEKSFTLADKRIVYEKNGILYHLTVIAFPEFHKVGHRKYVTFVIHKEIWYAMCDFVRGYRLVSLPVLLNLQSTYSVIMYILCSQQSTPITYSVRRLREVTNTIDKKSYDRTNNFTAKVLDVARAELDKKAPYSFDYGTTKGGRAIELITIVPRQNRPTQPMEPDMDQEETLAKQRIRLHENVTDYLVNSYGMTPEECERVEGLLAPLGDWTEQVARLADIKRAADIRRVQNPKGYLIASLKNGTW